MTPMRPRFSLVLPTTREAFLERLRARLEQGDCPCRALIAERHVELKVVEPLRHMWSPQLSVELEPTDAGLTLHALLGPSPTVWTTFMATYAFLGFSALFSGMLGAAQLGLGQTPWGLVVSGLAAACLPVPYLLSRVGQRLAAEHTTLLRSFLTEQAETVSA